MKIYKYLILFCFLSCKSAMLLVAQNDLYDPIDLGNKSFSFTYTDSKNTSNYTDDYWGQDSNDVFYKFTLTRAMDISIDHCGSELNDTYLHILDENGNELFSNDDDWEFDYCGNPYNSYLYLSNLPAGTYYAVSEGYSENGNITTTIQGFFPLVENSSNFANAINIGSKTHSFEFVDTKNTTNYPNDYRGQMSNDVFYKFAVNSPMDVVITHCGSELNDTYLHLLDVNGNHIQSCDNYFGADKCANGLHAYIKMSNLNAGTYYVVSEGIENSNGNITTTIKGIRPLPATGIYDGSAIYSSANLGKNYIHTITPTIPTSDVSGLGVNESLQTIAYFDVLGRPTQTVQRGITPSQHDLVTLTEYDGAGREWKQWLPKSNAGNGAFVESNTFIGISQTEYGSDSRPYSEAIIEASPLNRVLGNKGPGQAWINNSTSVSYEANTTTDAVAYFYVNDDNNLTRGANYAQATLYKTVSKDEDKKTVEEYKDKLGQVVLKRSKNGNENIDTYFVYNDLGQLAYVLPPLSADGLKSFAINNPIADSHDRLKKYGYLYKYDESGNCKEKKLPGCEPVYMVYDQADRLVLSQDGNQREKTTKEWTVTKYDVFGRVIFTGITKALSSAVHVNLITSYKDELIVENFVNGAYTTSKFADATPLTINYYDSYNFINDLVLPSPLSKTELEHKSKTGYDVQYSPPSGGRGAAGLLTGTRTYLLDCSGNYTVSAIYYDYRGRVVQTRATNHLGGYDITYNELNFSGQPIKTLKEHSIAASINTPLTELYTHDYDHAGRLRFTKYKINNSPDDVILVDNSDPDAYDELGRLRKKKRHNRLDTEEFDYNIRNWTERIKSRTFEQKLYYNTGLPAGSTACYNGNIAFSTWTYNGATKGYKYTYDKLNRLTDANHIVNGVSQDTYNEYFYHDKMGNIYYLERTGSNSTIDYLNFTYNGNQITAIMDDFVSQNSYSVKEYQDRAGNSYNEMAYDANGNLIKDLDRDILTIRYNVLNLPDTIQFRNGNQIANSYDASGRKLAARNFTNVVALSQPLNEGEVLKHVIADENGYLNSVHNIGNVEYSSYTTYNFSTASDVEIIQFSKLYNSEGYVAENSTNPTSQLTNPEYYYFCRDHLGNIREVWRGNRRTVVQRTQYYPSGLPWAKNPGDDTELPANANNRKYNGKEFVEMHGYDTYDIVWRQYYPAIGRFQSIDPEIEQAYNESPYAMCDNNMVNRTDPDGRFWNYVIGGAIGAGVDYASQVAVNLVEGKGIKESLTQVDGKSIMVSAVAGATGVGLASLTQKAATVYKLGSASSKVVNASTSVLSDAAISTGSQYAKDGKVSAKNVVVDVVAGQAGRGAGNTAKANAQSSQTGVSYQKQANRATGKAMHNPNTAKSTRAEAAKAKANNYGSKTETAASSATSNTISSINENSKKIK